MGYFKIDGKAYDVVVAEVSENFTILFSENTGRTVSVGARMVLDPLGTFYGHRIVFQRKQGKEAEYDELFDYLSTPRAEGMAVEFVHNQQTISYEAYVSNGERSLKRIDPNNGKVYWAQFSANFVPMEAQIV